MENEENKEELSPAEPTVTEGNSEHAPAESQDGNVEAVVPETEQETIEEIKNRLAKAEADRDNYKNGLLAEKNKHRMKELSSVVETPREEEPVGDVADIRKDYQSKRADIMAEYETKVRELSDAEYQVLQKHLKARELALVSENESGNRFVARKHIKDMFDEAFEFVGFKFHKPQESQQPVLNPDIGSTVTSRSSLSKPSVSEETKVIARESGLTPERIEELKKKGLL